MSLDAAPIPVTHLLWPQLGNRDSIPPSWVIGTFGIEHSGILNPWMPPGRGGTARWLPSPPDPATAIVSLPSQHSMPGKHNPSTEAQLPHCTPSTAALPLSTVPTAFTQLPIKPSNLTRPRAPLSAAHTSHTPSPAPPSACASHHAHKPCQAAAPQSRSLPNTFPPDLRLQGKRCQLPPSPQHPLPDPPPDRVKHLWKHHPGAGRPPDRWAAPRPGTEPLGEGPRPRDPAAIALLFRSSVTSLAQGRGITGRGRQRGPNEGYVHGQGVEKVPASLILFVFQCETRSVICLKWLIGIFCLFFFLFFSFLFVKRG